MRLIDIAWLALHDLRQRKLRTLLNLLGVIIGCMVLLLTTAATSGIWNAVQAIFDSSEYAREIRVRPSYYANIEPPDGAIVVEGEMSDERRERLREALTDRWKRDHADESHWTISLQDIEALEKIPHVKRVIPGNHLECRVNLGETELAANLFSCDTNSRRLSDRLIAGKMLPAEASDEVLISEFAAYQFGFHSDAQLAELIGQPLTVHYQVGGSKIGTFYSYLSGEHGLTEENLANQIEFAAAISKLVGDLDRTSLSDPQKEMIRKATKDLSAQLAGSTESQEDTEQQLSVTRHFRVCGVVRSNDDPSLSDLFRMYLHGSEGDLFLHHRVATELQSQNPARRDDYYSATVVIDSSRNLRSVTEAIEDHGLSADSALGILDSVQWQINNSRWFIYSIAAAVLAASALGISNTLIISVLQRMPEFGIMKAVGARDRDVVLLMLCEGAILGVIGATLALLIGMALSYLGHGLLERHLSNNFGDEMPGRLFQFQLWSVAMMYGIAMVICIGASILPAWRAARLDPVVAMRRT